MTTRKLITFDWALKKLLRSKATTAFWKASSANCCATTSAS